MISPSGIIIVLISSLAGTMQVFASDGGDRPTGIDESAPYSFGDKLKYHKSISVAPLKPGDGHQTGDAEAFRYENLHWPAFVPGVLIRRGGPVSELDYALRPDIGNAVVETRLGRMKVDEFVQTFPMDGVLIIHRGRIVYESYPRMRAGDWHMTYSVSKVIPSLLVALLEERGRVDTNHPVEEYIPTLVDTGWAGVRIRNILDMASGVEGTGLADPAWAEAFWASLHDRSGTVSTYDFIASLKDDPDREQGTDFDYSTRNTFVLAWLVEVVTGLPFAEVVSREIWEKIGAEQSAHMGVSATGAPHAKFSMTLRDLGRFGLLYTPSWRVVSKKRIVSVVTLRNIREEGRPELLKGIEADIARVSFGGEPVLHNAGQWDAVFEDGSFFKSGFAGQGLLISPAHDLVVAFYGSWPDMEKQEYNRFQWIARQLINRGMFD